MESIKKAFTKESIKVLKGEIKKAVDDQKMTKNQRKSDAKIEGIRIWSQSTAQASHASNRIHLRYLYAAYAISRGKDLYMADKTIRLDHPAIKGIIDSIIQASIETSEKALCNNQG